METKVETSKNSEKGVDKSKGKTGLLIGVIIAVVAVIAVVLIIVLCANSGKKSDEGGNGSGSSSEVENTDNGAKKWVGSDKYGYVEVPESWSSLLDSEEGLQYGSSKTDASKGYYISMMVQPTSEINAESWAEGMKKVFEETNVSDIEVTTKKVGDNTAHVVAGYYSEYSRWLTTYTIDTNDGKTHYISIEGPDKNNAAFKIPETFKLTK